MNPRRKRMMHVYWCEDLVFLGTKHAEPIGIIEAREIVGRYSGSTKVFRQNARATGNSGIYWPISDSIGLGRLAGRYVLLHELAHAMVEGGTTHGVEWRTMYVKLVEFEIGRGYAARLRVMFRRHGHSVEEEEG